MAGIRNTFYDNLKIEILTGGTLSAKDKQQC